MTFCFSYFFRRLVKLFATFVIVANAIVIAWLVLSRLWSYENTALFLQSRASMYPATVVFYTVAITPFVFVGQIVFSFCLYIGARIFHVVVGVLTYSRPGHFVTSAASFASRPGHFVTSAVDYVNRPWAPLRRNRTFFYFGLLGFSYLLLAVGVRNWTVYLLLHSFFVAAAIVYRAESLHLLGDMFFYLLPSSFMDLYCSFVDYLSSFFICYRESFKDIPMADIRNPDSIGLAVQTVRSLSYEIRVILLALGLTVFHNGKYPKSKKTIGFEFGLIRAAFPHVCEGISRDDLSNRHNTHQNQAGLIRAVGCFYVVYCLFVLAVMQVIVVGSRGSKTSPNSASCYARVHRLFNRRNRAKSTRSNFKLDGRGYLAFLDRKEKGDRIESRSTKSKTGSRSRRSKTTTRAATDASFIYLLLFIYCLPSLCE